MKRLAPFVGEWSLPIGGRAVFDWLPGRLLLVQRWEEPDPAVPDGMTIIGFDADRETTCSTTLTPEGCPGCTKWASTARFGRSRPEPLDFSPLDFAQRFAGRFSEDGRTITGRWECSPYASTQVHGFDLTYTKVT